MIKSIFASSRFAILCLASLTTLTHTAAAAQKTTPSVPRPRPAPPPAPMVIEPPNSDYSEVQKQQKKRADARDAAFEISPSPATWKIQDADTTVYLFGAIKNVPYKLNWQSPEFTEILDNADNIYFETPYYARSDKKLRRQYEREGYRKLIRHDRDPVEQRFIAGLFAEIEDELDGNIIPMGDFMPTWLMVGFMADIDKMFQPGRSARYIDNRITRVIEDRGVAIKGLENATHLIDLLNGFDEKTQRQWLNGFAKAELAVDKSERYKALQGPPYDPDVFLTIREKTAIDWAKGVEPVSGTQAPDGLRDMLEVIRSDRMKNWTKKIDAMMDDPGKILIVVSQDYLYGNDNLRSNLEKQGHKVTLAE